MKMGIDFTGVTKLIVVLAVCIAAIILGYAKILDSQAVVALLSASLGYVYGNGHGIISAQKAKTGGQQQ